MTAYRQDRPLSKGHHVNPWLLLGVIDSQWRYKRSSLQEQSGSLEQLGTPTSLIPCSFCPPEIILFEIASSESRKRESREGDKDERCSPLNMKRKVSISTIVCDHEH